MRPLRKKDDKRMDLFRERLDNILNRNHELYRLVQPIDWEVFEQEFGIFFPKTRTTRDLYSAQVGLSYLGRVYRDILRKILDDPDLHEEFHEELELMARMLDQQKKDKNKLYSIHAPEVECIAKGKVHKKYEFGVKVSVATTSRDYFVIGMQALPGNPFDGHTLAGALEQVNRVTGIIPDRCYVDRGYRGHGVTFSSVFISGQRRGVTPTIKNELRRRSAVEPIIGHMKNAGKLGRNWLKGSIGDKINDLLCGAGHNIRIILRKLRDLLSLFRFSLKSFNPLFL